MEPITSGPWRASRIVALDAKERTLYFHGNAREKGENVYYEHLYRVKLDGTGLTRITMAEGSHRVDLSPANNYFIEPTANLSYTRSTFDNLPILNGTGVIGFNTVESLLGRAGARAGTAFSYGGFNWSPFGIAIVQHEFMGNADGTFTGTSAGSLPFLLSTTRVGTFYTTSLGLSFKSQTSGLLGFIRGDYRFGDNLHGAGVVGGVRYTFGP